MIDNRLLSGRPVRDRILSNVSERVAMAGAKRLLGRIVSVSIGENKAAAVYVRSQANAARKVGLRFDDQVWPSGLKQEECKARLVKMNDDADVLGVILQRPVPRHINVRSLASAMRCTRIASSRSTSRAERFGGIFRSFLPTTGTWTPPTKVHLSTFRSME